VGQIAAKSDLSVIFGAADLDISASQRIAPNGSGQANSFDLKHKVHSPLIERFKYAIPLSF
jgi:hypothetical protein